MKKTLRGHCCHGNHERTSGDLYRQTKGKEQQVLPPPLLWRWAFPHPTSSVEQAKGLCEWNDSVLIQEGLRGLNAQSDYIQV